MATPIGNLEDMSDRARQILNAVDLIAAEDTRQSRKLLSRYDIRTPMTSYHEHNEDREARALLEKLRSGQNIALISDAGTPLISDPGYTLVRQAHREGIRLVAVPGACALVAALSVSGLPTDRFCFEGFLPEKQQSREKRLQELSIEKRTLVFYESPHRIEACLDDCTRVFGEEREACLARELSKLYETVIVDSLGGLLAGIQTRDQVKKGEFVLCIAGNSEAGIADEDEASRVLAILLQSVSLNEAVKLAVQLTGRKKNKLYALALEIREKHNNQVG